MGSIYPDLPVLSEFQSEVLWAFFESRSEADAASPPHEDCEALGREVGKRYRDMRRSRTIIQAEQLDILYGCYFKDPNPGKHEFEQISEWVHLPKKVVQIWFQNMRARERKGEVRFISDGTLAAVGKPLIKFTWPLSKPIFSNKPASNNTGSNTGGITTTPIVSGSAGEIVVELPAATATSNS
uniref:Homeobox domain-containing protein n=1 Tax=Stegastes partitus TaxID=144197 RepID=A0A3B5B7B6_9TELE